MVGIAVLMSGKDALGMHAEFTLPDLDRDLLDLHRKGDAGIVEQNLALARCRQLGSSLVAARLDRITRRAHTLSQLLEDGISIRAADMAGADDLMIRIYAATAQKERELISGPGSPWRIPCQYRQNAG